MGAAGGDACGIDKHDKLYDEYLLATDDMTVQCIKSNITPTSALAAPGAPLRGHRGPLGV